MVYYSRFAYAAYAHVSSIQCPRGGRQFLESSFNPSAASALFPQGLGFRLTLTPENLHVFWAYKSESSSLNPIPSGDNVGVTPATPRPQSYSKPEKAGTPTEDD